MEFQFGLSKCEGCGDFARLVRHHWYQVDAPDIERARYICQWCNTNLKTTHFWPNCYHIMPTWEVQLERIKDKQRSLLKRLLKEFPEESWWIREGAFNPYLQVDSYVLQD